MLTFKSIIKKFSLKKKKNESTTLIPSPSPSPPPSPKYTGKIMYIEHNEPLPTTDVEIGDVVIPMFDYDVYNMDDINLVVRKYKTGVHCGIRWEVEEYTNNNRMYTRIE